MDYLSFSQRKKSAPKVPVTVCAIPTVKVLQDSCSIKKKKIYAPHALPSPLLFPFSPPLDLPPRSPARSCRRRPYHLSLPPGESAMECIRLSLLRRWRVHPASGGRCGLSPVAAEDRPALQRRRGGDGRAWDGRKEGGERGPPSRCFLATGARDGERRRVAAAILPLHRTPQLRKRERKEFFGALQQ